MTRTLSAFALSLAGVAAAGGAEVPVAPPLQAAHQRPLTDVVFERTSERVERGRYLANHAIGCVICHSERDDSLPGAPPKPGREFAGAVLFDQPDYFLAAPNLTPDSETGAGSWSDDMLSRAIREGVGHDGRGIGGVMWWWAFRFLSDEDTASIVVYLRSLPPVANRIPPRRISESRERQRADDAKPLTEPVPAPDLSTPLARGTYLQAIADCAGCHSAWEGNPNAGLYAGGNAVERAGTVAYSANLTSDPSALGSWTPEIFRARMRSGRGGALHPTMPWVAYRGMTDDDLDALFAALQTLPPVRHWVNNIDPPTACVVCGGKHGMGDRNVTPDHEPAGVDLGPLDAYAGRYTFEIWTIEISARDGKLWATDGGAPIELVATAGGRFQGRGLVSPFEFERDASGKPVALTVFEVGTTRWVRAPEAAPGPSAER